MAPVLEPDGFAAIRGRRWVRAAAFTLAILLLSALVLLAHLRIAFELNDNPGARFQDQVRGRAARPYAYRVLAPATARLVARVVPRTWTRCVADAPRVRDFFAARGWQWDAAHHDYLAGFAVMYAGLAGFAWAARGLFSTFFLPPWPPLLALFALAGVPFAWAQYGYLYDFPQLALFTLGLALMARGRWRAYLALFPLLCLSKETSALLVLLFALHARQVLPPRRFRQLLVGQAVAWAGLRLALVAVLRQSPGSTVEMHLYDHNIGLWNAWWATGDGWPAVSACAAVGAMVAWRLRHKPPFLRRCLWLLPPLLALGSLFGYFEERRQYMELYAPIVGLLFAGIPTALRPGSCQRGSGGQVRSS